MNTKKTCVIIGAAPGASLEFLDVSDAFVIAADGGYDTAGKTGINVDYVIGDFDSAKISPDKIAAECAVLPREKDFSDVHVAVDKAIEMGFDKLVLVGCLGGRCDHMLANISLLEYIARRGKIGILRDSQNEITCLLPGAYEIPRNPNYSYLSLISLDSSVCVSLKGLYYPLEHGTLLRHVPVAISNEWTEDVAHIEIEGGAVLLILSGDEEDGKY